MHLLLQISKNFGINFSVNILHHKILHICFPKLFHNYARRIFNQISLKIKKAIAM